MGSPRAQPVPPLEAFGAEFAAASSAAIGLREVPLLTQIAVRARPGSAAHEAIAAATGVGLPARAGEVAGSPDGTAVLWLGPDEFLVIAPPGTDSLTAELEEALADAPGQVVKVSAARAVIELTGPAARDVLEGGVPADLHPRVFPAGRAVTTQLGAVRIILWHTHPDRHLVLVGTSFAGHVARWLLDALHGLR